MSEKRGEGTALPGILGEIAHATTPEIAIAMARLYGGRRLSLPTEARLKRDHPLCRAIGARAARILCARFGGMRYDVPSARPFLNWHDARRLRAEGKSIAAVARMLRLGQRHVLKLLEGFEAASGSDDRLWQSPSVCPACGHRHRSPKTAKACDARQLELALERQA